MSPARAILPLALVGALLHAACTSPAPAADAGSGGGDSGVAVDASEADAADAAPCDEDLPRGGGHSDNTWSAGAYGCPSRARPSSIGEDCACQPGDYGLELTGDGAPVTLRAPYGTGCGTLGFINPVCVPDKLGACGAGGGPCVLLRERFDSSVESRNPAGHYVDREGRCWTLYDVAMRATGTGPGRPVTGSFEAVAERCGAPSKKLSGTFKACLAYSWAGTCK